MTFHSRQPGPTKHDKELARAQRRAAKAQRLATRREAKAPGQGAPVEQFPTRFPAAPEDAAGVGRVLSRGMP